MVIYSQSNAIKNEFNIQNENKDFQNIKAHFLSAVYFYILFLDRQYFFKA